MADRKLMEDYENALMSLAVSDMLEKYGRELEEKYKDEEDIAPSPEAAAQFEKSLNRAYRKGRLLSFHKGIAKFGRYAVTACAALIIVIAVSVVSVDAVRMKFLEWLIGFHGTHTSLTIDNGTNAYDDIIHADYLPLGYKISKYNNADDEIDLRYSNDRSYITIIITPYSLTINVDNEDTIQEEVLINENKGYYQKKESISDIYWHKDKQLYWISTNDPVISKKELVKIAQSIN